jgi:hypothetical protein
VRRLWLRLALCLALLALFGALTPVPGISRFYFNHQDSYVIAALIALLFAHATAANSELRLSMPDVRLDWRILSLGAAGLALVLWAGTYLLLDNYPLTRDEHMVVFDMAVFRSGHLAAPLPPQWRAYAQALTPAFALPLPANAAWVSAYMPVNAMMRTAFGALFDPALLNPVLVALGAVALFDITKRLFPRNSGAQWLALLLYGTSPQVLVTAMTPYAMTAHLALDLIWLALLLRGTRASHAAAILIGLLAIGLHQVIFHPLFALPFIDHLRRRGEWRTAAIYVLSYAVFGIFWISYPHIVAMSVGVAGSSGGAASGSGGYFAVRILPLLLQHDPVTFPLMAVNLVRFIAWQNLALVPLMGLGLGAVRRDEGIARPLLYGLVLTTLAMAILLPYQGHGWGYRYVHGLIGNCALLGAYGWRDFSDRVEVRRFVGLAMVATLTLSLPFLLWQAHAFVAPYARVNSMIGGIDADMVVVQSDGTAFQVDEVRNRPDLANRPLRLASHDLAPKDIEVLCSRGTVAFVDAGQMQALGVGSGEVVNARHFDALRSAASRSCAGQQAQR